MATGRKRKSQVFPASGNRDGTEPLVSSRDKDRFLAMDFYKTESILHHFPLVEGKGTVKMVPKHFLGHDTSVNETFWKIQEFRGLTTEEQNNEASRWRNMKPREQRLYKKRIATLVELQKEMKAESLDSKPASKKPHVETSVPTSATNPPMEPPPAASQATSTCSLSTTTTDTTTGGIASVTPVTRTNSASVSAASSQEETVAGAAQRQPTNDPAATTTQAGRENNTMSGTTVEPPETVAAPLGDVTNAAGRDKHIGLASDKEKRKNVMPPSKAPTTKPRCKNREHKKKIPCQDIDQQSDSVSMAAAHRAMRAVAEAIDTTSLPGRNPNITPGHSMVLFVLNEVNETNAAGGISSSATESLRREYPQLTAVYSSARDVKLILNAVGKCLKHDTTGKTKEELGFDLHLFKQDKEMGAEPLVAPAVKAYVKAYKETRKNPPKKARDWDDIQDQITRENSM
jgi:hypothetical protein